MGNNRELIRVPAHALKEGEEHALTAPISDASVAPSRDMMWMPIRGKETEVWAARSPDGKRLYNVRREWVRWQGDKMLGLTPGLAELAAGKSVSLWSALWSNIEGEGADGIPNVFTSRFLSVHEAKLACETLEHSFLIDAREVERFNKYSQSKLGVGGWTFQGIYGGTAYWTFRSNKRSKKCYVIINNMSQNKQQYELTLRTFVGEKYTNITKLKIEFISMFDSLEEAQKEVTRMLK